jgi:hypothetical protein
MTNFEFNFNCEWRVSISCFYYIYKGSLRKSNAHDQSFMAKLGFNFTCEGRVSILYFYYVYKGGLRKTKAAVNLSWQNLNSTLRDGFQLHVFTMFVREASENQERSQSLQLKFTEELWSAIMETSLIFVLRLCFKFMGKTAIFMLRAAYLTWKRCSSMRQLALSPLDHLDQGYGEEM